MLFGETKYPNVYMLCTCNMRTIATPLPSPLSRTSFGSCDMWRLGSNISSFLESWLHGKCCFASRRHGPENRVGRGGDPVGCMVFLHTVVDEKQNIKYAPSLLIYVQILFANGLMNTYKKRKKNILIIGLLKMHSYK